MSLSSPVVPPPAPAIGSRLQNRLRLAFFALALGPVLILSLLVPVPIIRTFLDLQSARQADLAARVGQEVKTVLTEREVLLRAAAREIRAYGLKGDDLELRLNELINAGNSFLSVALVNLDGQEVASAHYTEVRPRNQRSDRTIEAAFQVPLASGETYFGPPQEDPETGEPFMVMGVPYVPPNSLTPSEILLAEVRLKPVWEVVARFWQQEGLEAFVLSATNRVVAHRNPSLVLAHSLYPASGALPIQRSFSGNWVVTARSAFGVGEQVFSIVIERPALEALTPGLLVVGLLLALLLLGGVAASVMVRLAQRRISLPLAELAETARRICRGNLEARAPEQPRHDEIGDLALAFNAMTDNLRQSIAALQEEITSRRQAEDALRRLNEDLEDRVLERTAVMEHELQERRRIETALRDNEKRTRAIIESVVDGIIVADAQGIIETCNRATETIFGYDPGTLPGQPLEILMPEPEASLHARQMARRRASLRSQIIGMSREVMARHADGHAFPLDLAVSELMQEGRNLYIGVVRDISERKKYEQELRTAKDEADKANQAKSEFLSSMSHELRTPLNVILGFSQLLEIGLAGGGGNNRKHPEYVQNIIRAGRHLLALITEILDLAKIEARRISLSLEAVAPEALLHECLGLLEPLAENHQVSVRRLPTLNPVPNITADYTRTKQVLLNLGSNAIKYNRSKGWVEISCETLVESVRFIIRDNGIGIPPERQGDVFKPFNRLGQELGEIEGTGIGLTICKSLVEQMEGRIGFSSQPEKGSTFWIELPRHDRSGAAVPEATAAIAALPAVSAPLAEPMPRVLYIEDNPHNLEMIREVFAALGNVEMLAATNAEQGLLLARTQSPALILMDINLPGMDGFAAFHHLRAQPKTASIPVIALSANASATSIRRAMSEGFADYVTKPVDIADFLTRIRFALAATASLSATLAAVETPLAAADGPGSSTSLANR